MPTSHDKSRGNHLVEQEAPFLTSIKAIVAAIVLAVSFEAGARTLIPDGTLAKIIVPIISGVGLLAVCIYVITAKTERTIEIEVPSSERPSRLENRYNRTFRLYCIAGVAALSIIIFVRLWQIRPNGLAGKAYVSGFVCSDKTGEPITKGIVEIVGYGDRVVSRSPQRLDDRGFFYSTLDQWASTPTAIQIVGTGCGELHRVSVESDRPGACLSRALGPNTGTVTHEWVISCEPK